MRIPALIIITAACCFAAERAPLSRVEAAADAYIKAVAAAAAAVPDSKQGKSEGDAGATPSDLVLFSHWSAVKRKAKQMQEGDIGTRMRIAMECMDQLYGFYGIEAPVITPQPRPLNPR